GGRGSRCLRRRAVAGRSSVLGDAAGPGQSSFQRRAGQPVFIACGAFCAESRLLVGGQGPGRASQSGLWLLRRLQSWYYKVFHFGGADGPLEKACFSCILAGVGRLQQSRESVGTCRRWSNQSAGYDSTFV